MNQCVFSPCRKYRYTLRCRWDELFPEKPIAWIGLNPSTADELQLDPTLTRIKGFSSSFGFNCFYMLNIFAFRATDPNEMKRQADPVGPENDRYILEICRFCTNLNSSTVVAAWGNHGSFLDRSEEVVSMLKSKGTRLMCLKVSKAGNPVHPLYLPGDCRMIEFKKSP